VDYRGLTVYQNPPNSQGITMLMALKILEGYSFGDYEVDSPEAVHLQTEALKLAHSAKFYHVADPAFVDVPVDRLLSDANARAQRELISMSEALAWPIPDVLPRRAGASVPGNSGGDSRAVLAGNPGFDPDLAHTTTLHVVDRYGNGAAVTTSLGAQFLIAGPSGIHINNRMRMMSFYDRVPNSIAPGKKVRHTSNPYLVLKDGELYILGGNTGVDTQPQGQVQQFISVVEFGLSPQEAVARPRFVTTAFPAGQWPFTAENELLMEPGFPEETRRWLAERGHVFGEGGIFGTANMLVRDPGTGRLRGGADPRSSPGLALIEE
jgi:gamma-glutamyltranspeptidase/glutathione hydrolase